MSEVNTNDSHVYGGMQLVLRQQFRSSVPVDQRQCDVTPHAFGPRILPFPALSSAEPLYRSSMAFGLDISQLLQIH